MHAHAIYTAFHLVLLHYTMDISSLSSLLESAREKAEEKSASRNAQESAHKTNIVTASSHKNENPDPATEKSDDM